MTDGALHVVKVGGSLFDLPDLAERLGNWLQRGPRGRHVLIAGGGPRVAEYKAACALDGIDDTTAHWHAIELMHQSALELAAQLPSAMLTADAAELHAAHGVVVFSPGEWLGRMEPALPGICLPASWDVTSDSIAARVAIALAASRLVLMKSTPPPTTDLACLAESGCVDAILPRLRCELPATYWVDLRTSVEHYHEVVLS